MQSVLLQGLIILNHSFSFSHYHYDPVHLFCSLPDFIDQFRVFAWTLSTLGTVSCNHWYWALPAKWWCKAEELRGSLLGREAAMKWVRSNSISSFPKLSVFFECQAVAACLQEFFSLIKPGSKLNLHVPKLQMDHHCCWDPEVLFPSSQQHSFVSKWGLLANITNEIFILQKFPGRGGQTQY